MTIPNITPEQIELFLLIFLRVSAIVVVLPILGNRTVPVRVKAGLSFLIAFLIFPFVHFEIPKGDIAIFPLMFRMAGEVLVGVIIGFTARLLFAGIQMAGQLVGFQMGFGIVNVVDPVTSAQISIIAQFKYLIAMLIFLAINGHHVFLYAISESYRILPPLGFQFSGELMEAIFLFSRNMFIVAVKVGAPIMAVLLFTSVALGLIVRTVPQVNVFIVGFPLKIGVGMIGIGLAMPIMLRVVEKIFSNLEGEINLLLRLM